jgi:hypothetical protein
MYVVRGFRGARDAFYLSALYATRFLGGLYHYCEVGERLARLQAPVSKRVLLSLDAAHCQRGHCLLRLVLRQRFELVPVSLHAHRWGAEGRSRRDAKFTSEMFDNGVDAGTSTLHVLIGPFIRNVPKHPSKK